MDRRLRRAAHPSELIVINQGDASISIVDPLRNQEVATIEEGVPSTVGHEVAISPNGLYAYLPLYGDAGVGLAGFDGQLMLVIDISERRIIDRVDFGHAVRPHSVEYDATKHLLYVTTELDETVTIIDPHTLEILGTIPTGQAESHMLAISHDGRRGYTANVGPGTISVLDLDARELITIVPISRRTQRISISNDDRWVFTADQIVPQLAVIDTVVNELREWVQLPSVGYGSASTADGRTLLVTLPKIGELAAVDLSSMTVVRTLRVGPRPQAVLVRPGGKTAYVSCFGCDRVAVVDLTQWCVTAWVNVGQRADGMAWAAAAIDRLPERAEIFS
jgi:DNA-binding beta-propeller fold protein YncE